MHIIPQTFYTLHFNERDAAEIVAAANTLLNEYDAPIREFPILDNLFQALSNVSGSDVYESYEMNEPGMLDITFEPEDPEAGPEEAYD